MTFISGISLIRNNTLFVNQEKIFSGSGSLDEFLDEAYGAMTLAYPKFFKMDRLAKLGVLASDVLLKKYPLESCPATAKAIVLSNSQSSLDTDRRYQSTISGNASPSLFVYTLPNIVSGEISIRQGMKGENAFFIMPGFDATQLVSYVDSVLHHTQVCLAGWVDVLHEHHDVFLYLAEKTSRGLALGHTAEQLNNLYHSSIYGTVDGRP